MINQFNLAFQKVSELRIPITTLSQLCGISNAELSALFNFQKPCSSEKAAKIWKTLQALDSLVKAISPVPVDFRRAIILREILNEVERGNLLPIVVKPETVLSDEIPEIAILVDLAERRLQREKTCQNG